MKKLMKGAVLGTLASVLLLSGCATNKLRRQTKKSACAPWTTAAWKVWI
ncbi:MAG: hypothetical protein V8T10_08350 [Merdibacter sp.]